MRESSYASASARPASDLLCIDIGDERFALTLASVEEMVDADTVEYTTGIRNYNRNMVGVLRLRDELLPVYEAAHVLKVHRTGRDPVVLVLQGRERVIGLLVDGAEAAQQVSFSDLRTPDRLMSADRVLDGVLNVAGRWVAVLNTGALVDELERVTSDIFGGASHAG